jgi:hypothetical protein
MQSSRQQGQASIELLAVFPLILLVLLGGWQLALAGHTWWKLREAVRIGARAQYVAEQRGEPAAGLRRVRRTTDALLGETIASSRRVRSSSGGRVSVSVRIPLVLPLAAVVGNERAPRISASSRMAP